MAFSTPIHTNEQSVDRVLGAGLPVLLVFERKDCVPCQQIEPALARLAAAYAGKVLIARVGTQDNPGLVQRYGITRLPGLVFVKGGAPVAQSSGAAPELVLRAWLDYLIGGGTRPELPSGPSVPLDGRVSTPVAGVPPQQRSNGHSPRPTAQAAAPTPLSDATFDQVVGGSSQPVLVDFWAPWCGPCRAVAPAVEQLAQEFAGRAIVAKLNVDENPRTAQRFGINGIPALYIFKRGQVVERLVGAQPASVLRQALARHAG
jgi:thioredoxin